MLIGEGFLAVFRTYFRELLRGTVGFSLGSHD